MCQVRQGYFQGEQELTSNNSVSIEILAAIDRRIENCKKQRANGKRANGRPLTSIQKLIYLGRMQELEELRREVTHAVNCRLTEVMDRK